MTNIYLLLVEKAAAGDTSPELWGEKGYILVENGEHVWTDLARLIATTAAKDGYIEKDPKEGELDKDEAVKQAGFEAVSWGLNSRGKALRAKKFLGWSPKERSIEDEVPSLLKQEKERL